MVGEGSYIVGYVVDVVSRNHKLLHEQLFMLASDPDAFRSARRRLDGLRRRFKEASVRVAPIWRGKFKPW